MFPFFAMIADLMQVVSALHVQHSTQAAKLGELFMGLGVDIAAATIPIVVLMAATFFGFNVMSGKPVLEPALKMAMHAMIAYTMIFSQLPFVILHTAYQALKSGGDTLGGYIAITYGTDASSPIPGPIPGLGVIPVAYWWPWMGDPTDPRIGYDSKFKYSFIRERIFPIANLNAHADEVFNNRLNDDTKDTDRAVLDLLNGAQGGIIKDLVGGMQLMFGTMQSISLAFVAAGQIMTAQLYPMFTYVSFDMGCDYAFCIGAGLGVSMCGFIFFRRFEDIWANVLQGLFSIALIRAFFGIMSGVGYAFCTQTFFILFPPGGGVGMGTVLNSTFNFALVAAAAAIAPLKFLGVNEDDIKKLISFFIQISATMGRLAGGVTVVAIHVIAGCSFAQTSLKIGSLWSKGFPANELGLLEGVQGAFQQITGAIFSGFGHMHQTGMQSAGGIASMLGGKSQPS